VRALTLPFYAGHLSAAPRLLPAGPINRDDRPVIEYAAPVTHRQQRTGAAGWFTSLALIEFFADLLDAVPPESDPYLARLDEASRQWVRAGYHRHAAAVHRRIGDVGLADRHTAEFEALIPASFRLPEEEEPADRIGDWERSPYN